MKISRREFLKFSGIGISALLFDYKGLNFNPLPEFPNGTRLGRVFSKAEVKSKPNIDSSTTSVLFNDNVFQINREVIGGPVPLGYKSRIWYESPEGYIPSTEAQPVNIQINQPLVDLPNHGKEPGFWAEVTVPYVDLLIANEPARSPLLQEILANNQTPRFYFSQVLWIDEIKKSDSGDVLYHVLEKYGTYGDEFWADGKAFKPLTPDDISPINPEITDKKIIVDIGHQTLSCYENGKEILYTSISSGAKNTYLGQAVDDWLTPVGDNHVVNKKYVSLHMAGGTNKASPYEDFAVSYTSMFVTGGVSFHSTYWHNSFGDPMSHGCVNLRPEEAKFIYRWTQPNAPYVSGFYEQSGYDGTKVQVIE